ncbi:MAG: serine/threonine-protein kinase [Candidatus Micrarchaeota archaeon]
MTRRLTPSSGNVIPIEAARTRAFAVKTDQDHKSLGIVTGERGGYELKKSIFKNNGTTELFLATDLKTNKEVIVKRVTLKAEDSTFKLAPREFDIINYLDHPNVVKAIDQTMTSKEKDGNQITEYFLVTEKVEGKNLREHSAFGTNFSEEEKIEIITQILQALEYLHDSGVIHRDVKPENIMVHKTEDGKINVTLVDFGVTLTAVSTGSTALLPIFSKGFTAPEVLACASDVDGRADIYSTSAVLSWIFTGLDGTDMQTKLRTKEEIDCIDGQLLSIIKKGLKADPEERYQTAKEMKEALVSEIEEGADIAVVEPIDKVNKIYRELKARKMELRTKYAQLDRSFKESMRKTLKYVIPSFVVSVASLGYILTEQPKGLAALLSSIGVFLGLTVAGLVLHFKSKANADKLKNLDDLELQIGDLASDLEEIETIRDLDSKRDLFLEARSESLLRLKSSKKALKEAKVKTQDTDVVDWFLLDLTSKEIQVHKNLNLEQTLALERLDFVILPNSVIDEILQDGALREKYTKLGLFPCRTGTWVELDGENCIIKQDGKSKKTKLHIQDGWYKKDNLGIPSGEPTNENDQDARFLWRTKKYVGPLVRGFDWNDFNGQDVGALRRLDGGYGVACISRAKYEEILARSIQNE